MSTDVPEVNVTSRNCAGQADVAEWPKNRTLTATSSIGRSTTRPFYWTANSNTIAGLTIGKRKSSDAGPVLRGPFLADHSPRLRHTYSSISQVKITTSGESISRIHSSHLSPIATTFPYLEDVRVVSHRTFSARRTARNAATVRGAQIRSHPRVDDTLAEVRVAVVLCFIIGALASQPSLIAIPIGAAARSSIACARAYGRAPRSNSA